MNNEGPITRDEMVAMFGSTCPIEAVQLVWDAPDEATVGQVRTRLREIAQERQSRRELLRRQFLASDVYAALVCLTSVEADDLPNYASGQWSRRNLEAMLEDVQHVISTYR